MVGNLAEFPKVCGRRPVMTADDLWCLPGDSAYAQEEFDKRCADRVVPVVDENELEWDDILLPAHKERRVVYEQAVQRKKSTWVDC